MIDVKTLQEQEVLGQHTQTAHTRAMIGARTSASAKGLGQGLLRGASSASVASVSVSATGRGRGRSLVVLDAQRRHVVMRGITAATTTALALVAFGGYLGLRPKTNLVANAAAAEQGNQGGVDGKSSLGYALSMSESEVKEAMKDLNDLQVSVTKGGTERAFTGKTVNGFSHDNKEDGVYVGAVGGLPLFDSKAKFDSGETLLHTHTHSRTSHLLPFRKHINSLFFFVCLFLFSSGTGWPSFFMPIAPDHVIEKRDNSIPFMPRVEILDAKSGKFWRGCAWS